MCVSFGDINNKGVVGVYNTTITEDGILIQDNNYWEPQSNQNNAYPRFVNLGQISGINNAGWSYGAQFGDLNNDGFMDLYVANGFISGKKETSYWYDYSKVTGGNSNIIEDARNWPDMNGKSQSGYEQNKIWLNRGDGTFEDVSNKVCPYVTYDSRAVAMADLFNTGKLDVIVANQNDIPLVYKNELQSDNHWVKFELEGSGGNLDAIGAVIGPAFSHRAYTSFHTINSWGTESTDVMVHELTHVWQYENAGAIYMPQAIHAQKWGGGYDYGDVANLQLKKTAGEGLLSFNREQQAQIVQDFFRLRQDGFIPGSAATPADLLLYADFVQTVSSLSRAQLMAPI